MAAATSASAYAAAMARARGPASHATSVGSLSSAAHARTARAIASSTSQGRSGGARGGDVRRVEGARDERRHDLFLVTLAPEAEAVRRPRDDLRVLVGEAAEEPWKRGFATDPRERAGRGAADLHLAALLIGRRDEARGAARPSAERSRRVRTPAAAAAEPEALGALGGDADDDALAPGAASPP